MPKILNGRFVILGGASQVGSHIADQLLLADAREVVLVDNLSLGSEEGIRHLLTDPRCHLVRADILRIEQVVSALEGADGAFHVVGLMASTIGQDPWLGMDVNMRCLYNTAEACRIRGVKKVVFSSSAGVYGVPEGNPITEDFPLRWQDVPAALALYGASKAVGESMLRLYRERHQLDYVALRYTAVYGNRQHRRALVGGGLAAACQRVRQGQPPEIEGNGEQRHDYIHVEDVARANVMAMECDLSGEALNICSGTDISRKDAIEMVLRLAGSALRPVQADAPGSVRAGASMPVTPRQDYSRERAQRLLGWEPRISLEEGIARLLRWCDTLVATPRP